MNIASSIYCMHFVQVISQADPDLVALHCQEIGGKDFEIQMPKVTEFIRYITALHCTACSIKYLMTLAVIP